MPRIKIINTGNNIQVAGNNAQAAGSNNGKGKDNAFDLPLNGLNPFNPEYVNTISGKEADDRQSELNKNVPFINSLDKTFFNKFMPNGPNNWMPRGIASWADDQLHMNDRRGNINGKNYYATRNLARLADRFNNEFTFAGGDVGTFDSHGKLVSTGGIQYEQNPQLNTMEQRQYEDSRGIANSLRESDVGVVDTLNKAVPKAYANAQDAMVQYRQYVANKSADINQYVRQMIADVDYRLPAQTRMQEYLTLFAQNAPRFLGVKMAHYLGSIPNQAWRDLISEVTQSGILPTNEQMLLQSCLNTLYKPLKSQGMPDDEIMYILNSLTYQLTEAELFRQLRMYTDIATSTPGTMFRSVTGKNGPVQGTMVGGPPSANIPGF